MRLKYAMRSLLISVFVIGTLTACTPKEKTVLVTPDGTRVTTSESNGTATYKDSKGNEATSTTNADGSVEMSGKSADGSTFSMSSKSEIDFAKFGITAYPNTVTMEGSTQNMVETDTSSSMNIIFFSNDSTATVKKFYDPLFIKDKTTIDNPEGAMITGKTKTNAEGIVIISPAEGKTQISITLAITK